MPSCSRVHCRTGSEIELLFGLTLDSGGCMCAELKYTSLRVNCQLAFVHISILYDAYKSHVREPKQLSISFRWGVCVFVRSLIPDQTESPPQFFSAPNENEKGWSIETENVKRRWSTTPRIQSGWTRRTMEHGREREANLALVFPYRSLQLQMVYTTDIQFTFVLIASKDNDHRAIIIAIVWRCDKVLQLLADIRRRERKYHELLW